MTVEQLSDLVKRCGENRSKVITRCIDRLWWQEIGSKLAENQQEAKEG